MVFRSGSGIGDRSRCALGAASALGAVCLVLSLLLPFFSTPSRAAAAAGADTASKIRIAFAGDSIVDNYWSGIERIVDGNPSLKNTVELGRFARNGTGLTRGDRVYWPREIYPAHRRRLQADLVGGLDRAQRPAIHRRRQRRPHRLGRAGLDR